METIWENFNWFWETYGVWIGVALIPAVITGLTLSPKTAGAVGYVEKVWNFVKMIADALSVLSHKDKPGTFQLPLKAGKLLEKKNTGPAAGIVFVIFMTSTQSGCAWWSKNKGELKQVALACATEAAQAKARPLLYTMVGILTGATEDTWKRQTKTLIGEFGKEAVGCATKYALEKVTAPVQSQDMDPEKAKEVATARSRALAIEEGWVYVE